MAFTQQMVAFRCILQKKQKSDSCLSDLESYLACCASYASRSAFAS